MPPRRLRDTANRGGRLSAAIATAVATAVTTAALGVLPTAIGSADRPDSAGDAVELIDPPAPVGDPVDRRRSTDRVGSATPHHDPVSRAADAGTSAPQPVGSPSLVADVGVRPVRVGNRIRLDPVAPIRSQDAGTHCATGLDAVELTTFFAAPIGSFRGADYQRTVRLADDRVVWTFQDAFIGDDLVHNAALLQSGRCFTLLNQGGGSWLFASDTVDLRRWHWILAGTPTHDGGRLELFVVEMVETGSRYLERPRPAALRRVVLDAHTFETLRIVTEMPTGDDLYGWSVTSDSSYTYLYSHCYRQFGGDGLLGFDPCVSDIKVARTPVGDLDGTREYWTGTSWTSDAAAAVAVVDGSFVGSGNNPAQVLFDGSRFVLVDKRDDWWGTTVEFGIATHATGPFVHVATVPEPLLCDRAVCNSYFASWLPWRDSNGGYVWIIGHNVWNGADTSRQLAQYRPTAHSILLPR